MLFEDEYEVINSDGKSDLFFIEATYTFFYKKPVYKKPSTKTPKSKKFSEHKNHGCFDEETLERLERRKFGTSALIISHTITPLHQCPPRGSQNSLE